MPIMPFKSRIFERTFRFKKGAGTSRGVMFEKKSYFIELENEEGRKSIGECGVLQGLSIDSHPDYYTQLQMFFDAFIQEGEFPDYAHQFPSMVCGIEAALAGQQFEETGKIFDNAFYNETAPIKINGLIWMGDQSFMKKQIEDQIAQGKKCIKLKVGAIDWATEIKIIQYIRSLGGSNLIIRVDANGAWKSYDEAMPKMEQLASLNVHSIEQPIAVNLDKDLRKLCAHSPLGIALDEELFLHHEILHAKSNREALLDDIKPQYVVLKPSLIGGFKVCDEWINMCEQKNIGYWITSALESNIGLNAISQYTFDHYDGMHQGLGTGSLYSNNFDSPLEIQGETIVYNQKKSWKIDV